jgi:LytS/YehU family sensor histidine kinase
MAALGNVLSFIPIGLTRVGQVGFDLSHIATFIVAIYGGPFLGFFVGFTGGIAAGINFGPMGWLSWLGLVGLPIGKSLTGLATGAIFKLFKIKKRTHSSLLTTPAVLIGFVPEFLFTAFFFLFLVPYFLGWLDVPLLVSIEVKAWGEILVMSLLMAALVGNHGFSAFMLNFFGSSKQNKSATN